MPSQIGLVPPLSPSGRVHTKRAFYHFLELKTSFLAYICILSQINQKYRETFHLTIFGGYIGKKGPQNAELARGFIRSIYVRSLSFSKRRFTTKLFPCVFFTFLIYQKLVCN